jgi:hypothetical protein
MARRCVRLLSSLHLDTVTILPELSLGLALEPRFFGVDARCQLGLELGPDSLGQQLRHLDGSATMRTGNHVGSHRGLLGAVV